MDKCFTGDLIRGRTVLLVVRRYVLCGHHGRLIILRRQTHNVAMVSPIARFVVTLGKDGKIASHGSVDHVLADDTAFFLEAQKNEADLERVEQSSDYSGLEETKQEADGKLTVPEEIAEGHVSMDACRTTFVRLSA